ncbi:DegV family protein [Dolosicoccus paucivorans]
MNQARFAIVVDTSTNVNFELAEKYDLELLLYNVQLGDKTYVDLVEITSREFFEQMDQYDQVLSGIPSPAYVSERIETLKEKGYEGALFITTSRQLTGMYELLNLIKRDVTDFQMEIVDDQSVGAVGVLTAIWASQLRNEHMTLDQVAQIIQNKVPDSGVYAVFRTLKYVVKGGRLNKLAGAIGSLLNIQPVLKADVSTGELDIQKRVRGVKRSFQELVKVLEEELDPTRPYYLSLFAGGNDKELAQLKEQLAPYIEASQLYIELDLTPVLGVHGGPKSLGAAYYYLD